MSSYFLHSHKKPGDGANTLDSLKLELIEDVKPIHYSIDKLKLWDFHIPHTITLRIGLV